MTSETIGLLGLFALSGYAANDPYPSPAAIFKAREWQDRETTLSQALRQYPLSEPAMQRALAQLLFREENDPDWTALDESESFQRYEHFLVELNKQLALKYDSKMSWHALVWANYNSRSDLAAWLVSKPRSLEMIFEMFQDSRSVPRGHAAELIAEALQDCDESSTMATCTAIKEKREQIRSSIRQLILDASDDELGYDIEALGLCGSETDAVFLEDFSQRKSARKIDPTVRQGAYRAQQAAIWLCRRAEQRIRSRAGQQEASKPGGSPAPRLNLP